MNSFSQLFPDQCRTPGKKMEYLSRVLLPKGRFEEYLKGVSELLHERVHYVDPVHELHSREAVVAMLGKYVPRVANEKFEFGLVHDGEKEVIWRWTIALKIRFTWFEFVIHGLVHARIEGDKIVYQREYYDPMESIGVIPFFGFLYKLVLKMG